MTIVLDEASRERILLAALSTILDEPMLHFQRWKDDNNRPRKAIPNTGYASAAGFDFGLVQTVNDFIQLAWDGSVAWWNTDGGNGGNVEAGFVGAALTAVLRRAAEIVFVKTNRTTKNEAELEAIKKVIMEQIILKMEKDLAMDIVPASQNADVDTAIPKENPSSLADD